MAAAWFARRLGVKMDDVDGSLLQSASSSTLSGYERELLEVFCFEISKLGT